jgi:hypothetical protein
MPTYALRMKYPAISNPFWGINSMAKDEGSTIRKEIARKHMIRPLGALDQIIFYVVDAPSQSEVVEYLKEIGISSNQDIFIREIPKIENSQNLI